MKKVKLVVAVLRLLVLFECSIVLRGFVNKNMSITMPKESDTP